MNQVYIPKNLDNPNILDEEIKAYYSLRPVNASNPDYNFDKQLNKVLTEYMETIEDQFKTDSLKRAYKSQLKKMILVDKPSNSKKYTMFLTWRNKQINVCKVDQKDLIIQQLQEENRLLKEKLAQYEAKESPSVRPALSAPESPKKRKRNKLSKYKVQEVQEVEEVEEVQEVTEVKEEPTKKEMLNKIMTEVTEVTEVKNKELSDEEKIKNHFSKVKKYISCIDSNNSKKEIRKAFTQWNEEEVQIVLESLSSDPPDELFDKPYDLLEETLKHL